MRVTICCNLWENIFSVVICVTDSEPARPPGRVSEKSVGSDVTNDVTGPRYYSTTNKIIKYQSVKALQAYAKLSLHTAL